ncbi:ABC transporter permease [Paenibacillus polymyxa]|jgi:NitT/TauT family transport system permease protein|uniref:ABC transporter permease n=1 Tax=Paenibacillus TaxID=44249 RepID=UPI0002EB1374|nr:MULTISPECIES: ABC transporter permease [Paenibacillus]AHM66430.1 ABC transporter permease [Paenibacillus polymyxa SQR-21]AIY07354.1 ABC transporter permease [Paenibacillus polymyxa]AUS27084.1 sulfonate ABC transporter permease [Paenibacillus polymyxa]KAE8557715.1 ABC transporter permease [Paenibacillus polymyxa]KAF6584421.1 ABC transporter permease [Paenibacillus sp. EKM211P]
MKNEADQLEQRWIQGLHQTYLRNRRLQKWLVTGVQTAILLLLFVLWEIAGRLKWIDVLLFSYPSKILTQIGKDAVSGELWGHVGVTVGETMAGFLLGTLLGTLLAVLIWWSPFLSRVLDPYMVVFNSMPKVALGPIFIVMFGAGFTAILMTTLSITVIITTLVVYNSFQEVDSNLIKVVRTFGGSRRDTFQKVILPASFPAIVSTLKVNVGMAWVGVIVGEFLVAKNGLGYLIIYGFQVFNFTLVMSSLLIIAVVATLMYQAVVYVEHRLLSGRPHR